MDWVDKVWGRTRETAFEKFSATYELEIKAGTYCSLHYHRYRSNKFILESGKVEIVEMCGPFVHRIMLMPDDIYSVPSLVPHMFIVHQSGRMREEYFSDREMPISRDDIVRLVEGGELPVGELVKLPVSVQWSLLIGMDHARPINCSVGRSRCF